MTRATFYGWGRTTPSVATLANPDSELAVAEQLATGAPLIARGLGRSYGDAAQLSGGLVVSNLALDDIGTIDEHGVLSVGAGVSIDQILHASIPQGWFVPVTPGTRQVTIGGAIAADVHGKNHHRDGTFSQHVLEMRLVTPSGTFSVSPTSDEALFWASAGGMGLTGVITSATIQMARIETDKVLVDTERFANLDGVMAAMRERDHEYKYSVAWVDCMTRGAHMGRAILTRANHATASDLDQVTLKAPKPAKLFVPFDAPSGLLNPLSVRAFNELWFRSAPKLQENEAQELPTFFHPLDGVRDWNRLYGKRGFVQYQFCVPDDAHETIVAAIARLSSSGVASFLAVLKRFGPANLGPLSFPLPGWTLALDLPVGPHALPGVLDDLDALVLEAKGRVYFAKDSRLAPEKVRAMYPRLGEFLEVKNRVDPHHQMTSDLARRLQLVGK
ncbi:MAG: FAD-binding oxidoreductase [Acidimicrobiales bacterium]